MAKVHDRVLELALTADESDDSLTATAIRYFRDRGVPAANAFLPAYTQTPGTGGLNNSGTELVLGELIPPPTHIRFVLTFQA